MIKAGTILHRSHYPSLPITIKEIITHKMDGKNKIAIDRPIYVLSYEKMVGKEETRLVETTMYLEDLERQIGFNLWFLPPTNKKSSLT